MKLLPGHRIYPRAQTRWRAILSPLLLSGALAAPQVSAQEPGSAASSSRPSPLSIARQHFARGVELYRVGAYDAALAEFTRAYELSPNYRILYNIAQIQAQRQDYVQALELFGRYLHDGGEEIPRARVAAVETEAFELGRRVAELRVESNVEGATLIINEVRTTQLPLTAPLRVNAGIHRLRVEKIGYSPSTRSITVAGGEMPVLHFELSPSAPPLELDALAALPSPPSPRAPALAPPPDRTSLWVGLGVTGALAAATAISGALTYRQSHLVDQRLRSYPDGLDRIDAARSQLRTYALFTDAFALSAVLAAGATTALQLTDFDSGEHPVASGAPPRRSKTNTELGAAVGPGGASVWLRGEL
jgi:tetratricopeptide (TPR) repeat protein